MNLDLSQPEGAKNLNVVHYDGGAVVEIIPVLLTRLSEAIERLNEIIVDKQSVVAGKPVAHDRSTESFHSIAKSIGRIADKMDPPPPEVVDSVYIASKLGCTTTWIAEMARSGGIPCGCIVPGTGNGKPWKFYRSKMEAWIESR